jgi:hypothetical protein
MHRARSFMTLLAPSIALLAIGCGDITDSVGEQGRLRFSLATDYEVEEDELSDATLVARHVQHLDVDLTNKGEDDINEPDEITYRFNPDTDTDIDTLTGSDDDPPDVDITVNKPGTYDLEAIYKGRVVDSIELDFDTPDSLEISVKVREPFDDDFEDVAAQGTVQVPEGSQAAFLPIPKRGTKRLAGDMQTNVTATPKELVVPGHGASFVKEQDVWSAEGNIDFYFIDPGTVTITISDPMSTAKGSFTFDVADTVAAP